MAHLGKVRLTARRHPSAHSMRRSRAVAALWVHGEKVWTRGTSVQSSLQGLRQCRSQNRGMQDGAHGVPVSEHRKLSSQCEPLRCRGGQKRGTPHTTSIRSRQCTLRSAPAHSPRELTCPSGVGKVQFRRPSPRARSFDSFLWDFRDALGIATHPRDPSPPGRCPAACRTSSRPDPGRCNPPSSLEV